MGWLSKQQDETAARLRAAIEPLLGADETFRGAVHAVTPERMSAKLFAIGVTDRRLVIREIDRKSRPTADAPVSLRRDEVSIGNVFGDGAMLSMGSKGKEVRFAAGGHDYRFSIAGGTILEDALAGEQQVDGLTALVQFLGRPD